MTYLNLTALPGMPGTIPMDLATGLSTQPESPVGEGFLNIMAQQGNPLLPLASNIAISVNKIADNEPDAVKIAGLVRLLLGGPAAAMSDDEPADVLRPKDTADPEASPSDAAARAAPMPVGDLSLLATMMLPQPRTGPAHPTKDKGTTSPATTTITTELAAPAFNAKAPELAVRLDTPPGEGDATRTTDFAGLLDDAGTMLPSTPVQPHGGGSVSMPVTSAPAGVALGVALSDRVIDMGVGGQWIDDVAREISRLAASDGSASFRMSPPHLGAMRIDVRAVEDAGASIKMTVETDSALNALRAGADLLSGEARHSGLRIANLSIEQSDPTGNAQPVLDPRHIHAAGHAQASGDRPGQDTPPQNAQPHPQGSTGSGGGGQGQSALDRQNPQNGQFAAKVNGQPAVLDEDDGSDGQSPPSATSRNARFA